MNTEPIHIQDISLQANQRTCFEHFSTYIYPGKKIAIMGINGAGKSTLLKIIQGIIEPTTGRVNIPNDTTFGYVPQTIIDYPELSGGQRFNKALSQALSVDPDVLCLDEPTNHLDAHNKQSLIHMLKRYQGTLLVVSHDPEILALDFDEIWHIEHSAITIFKGNYAEYLRESDLKLRTIEKQREQLQKEKRHLKKIVAQEQQRASSSKRANKDETDRVLLGAMKESGSHTSSKNLKRLAKAEEAIQEELAGIFVHKPLTPHFNLDARALASNKSIVTITNGSCGYSNAIMSDINMQLLPTQRIAIIGDNGTGKSTFLKALLRDPQIAITGQWYMPDRKDIGYLDQHYSTLNSQHTVFETIKNIALHWSDHEVRKHLNDFLFRTQEEVFNKVHNLSGGEKARLCLAQIAAKNPYLLLLDEITNNVDRETRAHIIEVLRVYPGAMILVTHDEKLLKELEIQDVYEAKGGVLEPVRYTM